MTTATVKFVTENQRLERELELTVHKGRWRSWLSHLSNTFSGIVPGGSQKVLSSNLGRLIFCPFCVIPVLSHFVHHLPFLHIMYLYELPTTGAISFSDFCVDQSTDKIHARRILEATQARANIRAALKASKRTEDSAKDYLSLTKVSTTSPTFPL